MLSYQPLHRRLFAGGGSDAIYAKIRGNTEGHTEARPYMTVQDDYGDLTNIKDVAAGSTFTCALTIVGELYCWGERLFEGIADNYYSVAKKITNLSNIKSLSAGANHVCIVTKDDTVKCAGSNKNGQLGINSLNEGILQFTTSVVGVSGNGELTGIDHVSAGSKHTCAIDTTGDIYCWGDNSKGQLGDGTTTLSKKPVKITDPYTQPK